MYTTIALFQPFLVVDCGPPPIPRSGIQTSVVLRNPTTYNSTITAMYECEEGYLPTGNIAISHSCNSDGSWSDNVTIECCKLVSYILHLDLH